MIITGKSRRNGKQLGAYVIAKGENERINVLEVRGASTQRADLAIMEFSLQNDLTKRGKCGLYHASISPAVGEDWNMSREDWLKSADVLEKKLGLTGQNRALVWHEKKGKDGELRQHLHCVWQREKDGKLIKMSHNYRQHDSARKELEQTFGHQVTRQPLELKEVLTKAWNQAKDGREVIKKAKELGVNIVNGARRAYTVIDRDGQKLDFVRQLIGVKTHQVKERLQGLESEMQHENDFAGSAVGRGGRKANAREQRQQETAARAFAGEKEKEAASQGDIQQEARANFNGQINRQPTKAERLQQEARETKEAAKPETDFQRRWRQANQNSRDDFDLSRER